MGRIRDDGQVFIHVNCVWLPIELLCAASQQHKAVQCEHTHVLKTKYHKLYVYHIYIDLSM